MKHEKENRGTATQQQEWYIFEFEILAALTQHD